MSLWSEGFQELIRHQLVEELYQLGALGVWTVEKSTVALVVIV